MRLVGILPGRRCLSVLIGTIVLNHRPKVPKASGLPSFGFSMVSPSCLSAPGSVGKARDLLWGAVTGSNHKSVHFQRAGKGWHQRAGRGSTLEGTDIVCLCVLLSNQQKQYKCQV